jgi:hypothetical protein
VIGRNSPRQFVEQVLAHHSGGGNSDQQDDHDNCSQNDLAHDGHSFDFAFG